MLRGTDKDTFSQFYLTYKSAVLGNAIRFLKCPARAEDITQEIFAKIWQNWRRIRYMKRPDNYIIRTTRNTCLNELKAARIKTKKSLRYIKTLGDCVYDADAKTLAKDLEKITNMVVEKLSGKTRLVCQMVIDGISCKEIALALNKRDPTILCQRQQGLAKVRSNIKLVMRKGLEDDLSKPETNKLVFERKKQKKVLYHIYMY